VNEPSARPPTPFERRVFEALSLIPRGRVTTYKLLAKFIGCRSSQAVGQALRRNPYAPQVPCHRVIGHDLRIGGYSGETAGPQLQRKLNLLAAEGVTFTNDGYLTPGHEPWDFS
jgi:methylated-DNA-[protein]-cysteine S-methyltransferase